MLKVLQISDTHLSRTHPMFQYNFEIILAEVARLRPDLVVYTGDLAAHATGNADDLQFASEQLARTPVPHVAIPGNHDVGSTPRHADDGHALSGASLAAFRRVFGADRFCIDLGGWRLLGLNSQLLGSGLPAELRQFAWLAQSLRCERPVAVFMHYPAFIHDPCEDAGGLHALDRRQREPLLELLQAGGNVRVVASGHLHQARTRTHGGIRFEWAPSTAFVIPSDRTESYGGTFVTGMLMHEFGEGQATTRLVEPPLIMTTSLRNWGRVTPHGYYQVFGKAWPVGDYIHQRPAERVLPP